MYSLIFLGALASSALGQAISFSNTTFTVPVKVGATWPISFSAGSGDDVAIAFGNSTYAFQVVDGLTAPGTYSWNVAVPVNVVAGIYQLALLQGDADPVFSPAFSLIIPPDAASSTTDAPTTSVPFPTGAGTVATTTTTVTAIYLPYPTGSNVTVNYITYIYYEEACGCHKTSSCASSELPASMSTTTVTYSAAECGCTTTVEAPCAETVIPVAPPATTAAATNTPVAPTVAPAAPAAETTSTKVAPVQATSASSVPKYTGAAEKLAGSSFGFLAMVMGMLLA